MQTLAEGLIFNCEDSDPKVRDGSCAALASLMNVVKSRGTVYLAIHYLALLITTSL